MRELRGLQFEQTVLMAQMAGGVAAPDAEHRAILDAVSAGDGAAARAAMRAHLAAILDRFHASTRARDAGGRDASGS